MQLRGDERNPPEPLLALSIRVPKEDLASMGPMRR